eukprot:scaffold281695_cov33-Tisochrysis_lutea.AAC.1
MRQGTSSWLLAACKQNDIEAIRRIEDVMGFFMFIHAGGEDDHLEVAIRANAVDRRRRVPHTSYIVDNNVVTTTWFASVTYEP